MASAIFDPHGFVERLTSAGMPEPQAEILAEEQFRLLHEQIATKGDILAVRADIDALRSDIDSFRVSIRGEMEGTERRLPDQLTVRFGGMLAVAVAVPATLVKLL